MGLRTELGKIESIYFGACGYHDALFGLKINITGKGWGVGTDITGGWNVDRTERTKWSEADRIRSHGEMCVRVSKLLKDAKVEFVSELRGKPVKCYFKESRVLDRFEILTEVL